MICIHEDDEKRALKHGKKELETIHTRLMQLYRELHSTDSLIRSISVKSIEYDRVGSSNSTKKDMTDLMLEHECAARQREIEIREEMRQLSLDQEMINRIRVCFQTLRGQEYEFLKELYIHGYPYKFVEKHSGVSHRTFEKIRKQAIKKIIKMYQSSSSNIDLIRGARGQAKKNRRAGKGTGKGDRNYHQLELDLKAMEPGDKKHM